jgi:hypothetical protein
VNVRTGEYAVMYIFIGSIDLSSVSYDCPIGFWNCFDDVAIAVFHLISIAVCSMLH